MLVPKLSSQHVGARIGIRAQVSDSGQGGGGWFRLWGLGRMEPHPLSLFRTTRVVVVKPFLGFQVLMRNPKPYLQSQSLGFWVEVRVLDMGSPYFSVSFG